MPTHVQEDKNSVLPTDRVEKKFWLRLVLSTVAFALFAQVFVAANDSELSAAAATRKLSPTGSVLLSTQVQSALQLDLGEPGEEAFREARVKSNAPFSLYAVGDPQQRIIVRWSTSTRDFVVPLRGFQDEVDPTSARAVDFYNRFRFTATQH